MPPPTQNEQECAQRDDPDPDMHDRLKAIKSAVAFTKNEDSTSLQLSPKPSGELCRK